MWEDIVILDLVMKFKIDDGGNRRYGIEIMYKELELYQREMLKIIVTFPFVQDWMVVLINNILIRKAKLSEIVGSVVLFGVEIKVRRFEDSKKYYKFLLVLLKNFVSKKISIEGQFGLYRWFECKQVVENTKRFLTLFRFNDEIILDMVNQIREILSFMVQAEDKIIGYLSKLCNEKIESQLRGSVVNGGNMGYVLRENFHGVYGLVRREVKIIVLYRKYIFFNLVFFKEKSRELFDILECCSRVKQRIYNRNVGIVNYLLLNCGRHGLCYKDILWDGIVGLVKAMERYDYRKEVRFITYASWWIKQGIVTGIKLLEKREYLIAMINGKGRYQGVNDKAVNKKCYDFKARLQLNDGKPVSKGSINIRRLSRCTPLDVKMVMCGLRGKFRCALKFLSRKERKIITLRFGLNGNERRTLEYIGCLFKVTRERIRQIESTILEKIKEIITNRYSIMV